MSTENSKDQIQRTEVNCLGLKCPLPVMRLEKAIREGAKHIELIADDPISVIDIPLSVAQNDGKVTQEKLANGSYIFHISI